MTLQTWWIGFRVRMLKYWHVLFKGGDRLGNVDHTEGMLLYQTVRDMHPGVIVETGGGSGVSSWYFLQALKDNDHGFLYTIDLPAYQHNIDVMNDSYESPQVNKIDDDKLSGWLVPQRLRARWMQLEGDSKDLLPDLMKHLGKLSIFLHDSDHSYSCVMDELKTVWKHIPKGGVVFVDDYKRSNAVRDFCLKRKKDYYGVSGMAVIQK